jgi:phosphatidylinositol glycan class B
MVASPELHSARFGQRTSKVLLWGLLLIAVALRIWAALTPGFHHPDAIYQYLDPAHRLLTGNGIITWEWRDSIRSWMLPALLAPPLWVGEIVEPDGSLPLILPRIATAAASLGIVWAGWHIGCRHSPLTAALAGFVAATWFELVFFAAETLAEPLAAAAIVPAIALITSPGIKTRYIFLAGMLLGFAALARPHYGIAAASGVLIAWRDDFSVTRFAARKWFVLIGGGIAGRRRECCDRSLARAHAFCLDPGEFSTEHGSRRCCPLRYSSGLGVCRVDPGNLEMVAVTCADWCLVWLAAMPFVVGHRCDDLPYPQSCSP